MIFNILWILINLLVKIGPFAKYWLYFLRKIYIQLFIYHYTEANEIYYDDNNNNIFCIF